MLSSKSKITVDNKNSSQKREESLEENLKKMNRKKKIQRAYVWSARTVFNLVFALLSFLILMSLITRIVSVGGVLAKQFISRPDADNFFFYMFLDGAFTAALVSAMIVVYLLRFNVMRKWTIGVVNKLIRLLRKSKISVNRGNNADAESNSSKSKQESEMK